MARKELDARQEPATFARAALARHHVQRIQGNFINPNPTAPNPKPYNRES